MENLSLFLLSLLSLNFYAKNPEPAQLRYSEEFILEKVLTLKNWEMRPDRMTNAFAVKHMMIFISDDAAYYERTGRCMDDSVAHELTHYLQTQFREKFCK